MNATVRAGNGGIWHWSSPTPYLFGGLAAMAAVIAVALIILACSYRKSASRLVVEDEEKANSRMEELDFEPKIVVIMAGDRIPSFIARPNPVNSDSQL